MFRRPARYTPRTKISPSAGEVSEARFKRFVKDMDVYERKFTFERTLDAFLDLYSAWKQSGQEEMKLRLVMLAFELHRLDPTFRCDLSFHGNGKAKS